MKTFKCICCGAEIKPLLSETYDKLIVEDSDEPKMEIENWMWHGGTVEKICMPYGSKLDGDYYYIGICDNCIEEKVKEGIIKKIEL